MLTGRDSLLRRPSDTGTGRKGAGARSDSRRGPALPREPGCRARPRAQPHGRGSAPAHPAAARSLWRGVDVVVVEATADGAPRHRRRGGCSGAEREDRRRRHSRERARAVLRPVDKARQRFSPPMRHSMTSSPPCTGRKGESACPPRVTAVLLDRSRGHEGARGRGLDPDLPRGRDRAADRRRTLQQGDRGAPP